jgi:hypothetical protein
MLNSGKYNFADSLNDEQLIEEHANLSEKIARLYPEGEKVPSFYSRKLESLAKEIKRRAI